MSTNTNSNRQLIRDALRVGSMTASQVVKATGLEAPAVSRALNAMVHKSKELSYEKTGGSYGKYALIAPTGVQEISLKLAQLRTHRDTLLRSGVTYVDKIIVDYENLLEAA